MGNIKTSSTPKQINSANVETVLQDMKNNGTLTFSSVGDIKTSLLKTDHEGWLVMDGTTITSNQYQAIQDAGLASVWANMGGTSSNRPDLKGRVLGMAKDGGSNMVGGFLYGVEDFTLDARQLPDHDHGISIDSYSGNSGDNGSHNHSGSTDNGSIANTGKYLMETDETSWGTQQGATGSDKYFPAMDSDDTVSHVSSTHNHGIQSDGTHNHTIDHDHTVTTTPLNLTSNISLLQPTVYLYHFMYIGV